jgi:hypothetical protein
MSVRRRVQVKVQASGPGISEQPALLEEGRDGCRPPCGTRSSASGCFHALIHPPSALGAITTSRPFLAYTGPSLGLHWLVKPPRGPAGHISAPLSLRVRSASLCFRTRAHTPLASRPSVRNTAPPHLYHLPGSRPSVVLPSHYTHYRLQPTFPSFMGLPSLYNKLHRRASFSLWFPVQS